MEERPGDSDVPCGDGSAGASGAVQANCDEHFTNNFESSADRPCTRFDLEQVMAVGLGPLYGHLERVEAKLDCLGGSDAHNARPSLRDHGKQLSHKSFRGHKNSADEQPPCDHLPEAISPISPVEPFASETSEKVLQNPVTSSMADDSGNADFPSRQSSCASNVSTSSKKIIHSNSGMQSVYQNEGQQSMAGKMVHQLVVHNEMAAMSSNVIRDDNTMNQKVLEWVLGVIAQWEAIQEPPRSGRLYCFVESTGFETICALVILINSIFVAYTADWEMRNLEETVPSIFFEFDLFFVMFYAFELLLRIIVHRGYFFVNSEMKWNVFDFFLVIVSGADLLLLVVLSAEGGNNLVFMRIIRMIKLVKILRAFRAMRFFKDLAVMLESFKNSFVALWWSLVMLLFMFYVFSLIFLQGLADCMIVRGGEVDDEFRSQVHLYFGTMFTSMQSLYMAVTGGNDWSIYLRVTQQAGVGYEMLFMFFTFFFEFALFNILTGIFVEKAVSAAQPDRDDLVLQQRSKARQDATEFRHMCNLLDADRTGTITWKDFEKHMHNEVMVAYMASIGLEVHEVELFFHIVAGAAEQGAVSIDRFVDGCMQMKGSASGIDMQRQLFEMHMLRTDLQRFEAQSHELMRNCRNGIDGVATVMATKGEMSNKPTDVHSTIQINVLPATMAEAHAVKKENNFSM